ncbi:response regulator transcription factor [Granulicella tundricola]|uniref:Two component transcriptional regulator, LuxR family n=1 Tax=Granulicella tundricola (strain ATCC BAA-1859 / DSM 23138 / MP5ACTX9) TaxID=1198114 RepID=E8X845_GRATM|nr:response regulator transcription factor [Granulicella tundricola]ADW71629.1 two component transcriptional regulator, LuxR family [Granulicella tundricola MP5ACTX9]
MSPSEKPITVVLAEDQGILRSSLTIMLGIEPDIKVVASVSNGAEALRAVGLHLPAVLVTDIEMPQVTGLDLAIRVKELYPSTRVLILTTFARPGYLRRALDAGAVGYLLKDCPSTEMAEAVRRVAHGERVIDPGLAAESWSADAGPLTEREREVLRRAGEGESTAELARTLRLTEGTIRNYLSEAISKLGAHNRTEAARLARAKGWL